MTQMPPIDFTVVGGFLGAGKTSFVNRILAATSDTRFAVLVNDFGALNIDESLIVSQTGKIMKLANGCICCSLSGGLVDAMLALMEYRAELDHILIEASGVSYPSRIMDFARIDRELRPGLTIVLVDAVHFADQVQDSQLAETVQAQIEGADLFLLSKTDIATPAAQAAARAALQTRHATVPIIEVHADDDLARFLVFDPLTGAPYSGNASSDIEPSATAAHLHATAPQHGFASFAMESDQPIDRVAFRAVLDAHRATILRGKGVVWFADGGAIWQQTGRLIALEPVAEGQGMPPEYGRLPDHSRIIVISPGDLSALHTAFMALGFVPVVASNSQD